MFAIVAAAAAAVFSRFKRPYLGAVENFGVPTPLVYAVMLAESGFDEHATSRAGAVGVMQLLPETAEFICRREHIAYDESRLYEGEYNATLGTLYLKYLGEKFPSCETALAAYNAGEGVVAGWLRDRNLSLDGRTLCSIPYGETRDFVKKVVKFRKIYEILY